MVSSGLIERVDVSHYRLSLHLTTAFVILSLIFWKFLELTDIKPKDIPIKQSLIKIFSFIIVFTINLWCICLWYGCGHNIIHGL